MSQSHVVCDCPRHDLLRRSRRGRHPRFDSYPMHPSESSQSDALLRFSGPRLIKPNSPLAHALRDLASRSSRAHVTSKRFAFCHARVFRARAPLNESALLPFHSERHTRVSSCTGNAISKKMPFVRTRALDGWIASVRRAFFLIWRSRYESNVRPSASEADTLSN